MFTILKNKLNSWNIQLLVRKSKYYLYLILLKDLLLVFIAGIIYYFTDYLYLKLWIQPNFFYFLVLCALIFYVYFKIVVDIVSYFYNLLVLDQGKLYTFKLWLFFHESIDVIELYRVQEIKAKKEGFWCVLLNVWNLHIVEQKDKEKIIYFLDNPDYIESILEDCKEKIIAYRFKLDNSSS